MIRSIFRHVLSTFTIILLCSKFDSVQQQYTILPYCVCKACSTLLHFEYLETLLMTSEMCIVLCTWLVLSCQFLPQQSSENCCIFCVAKNYRTHLSAFSLCWRPGAYASCLVYPPPLQISYRNHTLKFALLCSCYSIDITYPSGRGTPALRILRSQ